MILSRVKPITCPDCGVDTDFEIFAIIDAQEEPGLKEQLLSAKLWVFTCSACKEQGVVPFPLFYVDESKQLMLKLVFEDVDEKELDGIWRGWGHTFPPNLDQFTTREVHSYSELIEKIRIVDEDLDDHTIEVMKVAARREHPAIDEIRFAKLDREGEGAEVGGMLYFGVRLDGGAPAHVLLPLVAYCALQQSLEECGVRGVDEQWARVDREYGEAVAGLIRETPVN